MASARDVDRPGRDPHAAHAQATALDTPEEDLPGPVVTAPVLAACAEGRVASETTQGRCCWPRQSFSVEHTRCAGPPLCPPGLVAHGDDCVVPELVSPPVAPRARMAEDVIASAVRTERVRAIRHDLVGAGIAVLLSGWTTSAIYGPVFTGFGGSGFLWLVPGVGPLVGMSVSPPWVENDALDWSLAVGTIAMQIAGLVTLIVGVADRQEHTLEHGPGGTRRIALERGPTPTLRF